MFRGASPFCHPKVTGLIKTQKLSIFGNVAKRTLCVTACEKFVPRLNKHNDVIE